MKNTILTILILVVTTSCDWSKSNEELIEDAFYEFVADTFDDPESISEIISIIPVDTVSLKRSKEEVRLLKETCQKTIILYNEIDSLYELKSTMLSTEYLLKLTHDRTSINRFYGDQTFGMYLRKYISDNANREDVLRLKTNIQGVREHFIGIYGTDPEWDAIDSLDVSSPSLFGYEIKYRNTTSNGLKIQTHVGYIDSLTRVVEIYPAIMTDEGKNEISDTFEMLYILGVDYIKISAKYLKMTQERRGAIEDIDEMVHYIEAKSHN